MERVLALDLTSRGLAHAVLEGSERLLDWGVVGARTRQGLLLRLDTLVQHSRPAVVVWAGAENWRRERSTRRLTRALASLPLRTELVPLEHIQAEYGSAGTTKYEIATAIAKYFPELEPWLPRKRRLGYDEDARAGIFIAVSAGFTFLRRRERARAA